MSTPASSEAIPAGCTCPQPWALLVTIVEGRRLAARPAPARGPTAALFRAYCSGCAAEYPGHWRLVPDRHRAA